MKCWVLLATVMMGLISLTPAFGSITVTSTVSGGDGSPLVAEILGVGISASNISYTGANIAAGTFTGGVSAGIGIESGIILTSGSALLAQGSNDNDATTRDNGLSGDSDLDALIPGFATYDATVLEFDFVSNGGNVYFNYVFASEEYNEYTNTPYNDVFGFFMDGVNIALIPGTTTPVSINNVNGGNPLGVGATNPHLYNNNDLNDGGPFFDIEYDGFTDAFTAQFIGLTAGTHHIKLAIADAGDRILDSAVFIESGTFSDIPTPLLAAVPEPATAIIWSVLGTLAITLGWRRRRRTV